LDPLDASSQSARKFQQAVRQALSRWDLREIERDELLVLMGDRGASERLLASNKRLRLKSTAILTRLFGRLRQRSARTGGTQFWNVSFLGPLISEYHPRLDVDAYRQAVYRLLHSARLDAVFSIELQSLTNYPQKGQGRSFLLNAHAWAWSDDPGFSAASVQERLSARDAIFSEFGADTVWLTPRTTAKGEIEYLAHYLTKAPATGKYRGKDPENPSRWKLSPIAIVRADLQLRLFEILSHLEFTDLVWGVNAGTRLRSHWKTELSVWNDERCSRVRAPLDHDFDTGELWARVRSRTRNGSRLYHLPEFLGPRPRPIPSEALPRQGGRRLWPSERTKGFKSSTNIIDNDFWLLNERLKGM
jgi:hypothetical protein